MNSDELIDYIEANHLEYQVTNILLSNRNEIYFIPIQNPSIMLSASKSGFGISGFKYPNLCYPDMPRPIAVPSELQQWKTWNKILYHPEHLAGFIMKTSDTYTVSIFYSRKQNKYSELRNKAFKMYLDFSPINSLDSFSELAAEAESNITGLKNSYGSYELADTLMDNNLKSSIARNNHDVDELRNSYAIRLLELYDLILSGNFLNYESQISYGENTICVSSKFMAVPTIKTDIDQDVAIIHNDDQIPQILFKLAFDLKPTTFLIATGYVYDSGLQLIVPALASCYPGEKAKRELICGDLFHYVPGLPQRSPNRQTAIKLNELLEGNLFQHLYTHPKSFYHGKFYYLSNEENGYLIMGSSNMTSTAFTKNKEFDVLYRFEHKTSNNKLEQDFLKWYEALKEECTEIQHLDEQLFPINQSTDEYGHTKSSAIIKTITSAEERERFLFLEKLNPTSIDTAFFKSKFYRPFKNYFLFTFTEHDISILEGFSYGNSCYVLSITDTERIGKELRFLSKEKLKEKDYFVASIIHDSDYQEQVTTLLSVGDK